MNFNEFDRKMRIYEQFHDFKFVPDTYLVVRLDGRNFHRFTEIHKFAHPFDLLFSGYMRSTVKYLMKDTGFKFVYGYTQSDEISLLFDLHENSFDRKERKLNSILAGSASAAFTKSSMEAAVFDCRIIQLPDKERVIDYFNWRMADSVRNALSTYCYWTARHKGFSEKESSQLFAWKNNEYKNEFLFKNGINFNDVPAWQKRGVGFTYKKTLRKGVNPKTGQEMPPSEKNVLTEIDELPKKSLEYTEFLKGII
jgi:tRNA(His) 5'-end guanylyltransferase